MRRYDVAGGWEDNGHPSWHLTIEDDEGIRLLDEMPMFVNDWHASAMAAELNRAYSAGLAHGRSYGNSTG